MVSSRYPQGLVLGLAITENQPIFADDRFQADVGLTKAKERVESAGQPKRNSRTGDQLNAPAMPSLQGLLGAVYASFTRRLLSCAYVSHQMSREAKWVVIGARRSPSSAASCLR